MMRLVTLVASISWTLTACMMVSGQTPELCAEHSELFFAQLKQGAPWALQMYDSSSKLPDGLLMGSTPQLGNFDECLAVSAPANFSGQFCRVKLAVTRLVGSEEPWVAPLEYAVCAPSSCDASGVQAVAERLLNPLLAAAQLQVTTDVINDSCFHPGSRVLDAGFWATISFFVLILAVVSTATLLDFTPARRSPAKVANKSRGVSSRVLDVLGAFSLHRTLRELWSVRAPPPGTLPCLHGMRALSIAWVILGHRYVMDLGVPTVNLINVFSTLRYDWKMMPIMNGYLAVDTFFFMAGLLTCYVFMNDAAKGRRFNAFRYYLYRYIRLTPPLLVCVLLLQNVVLHVSNGPLWGRDVKPMADFCKKNWWASLLYVNNYVNFNQICVSHSWYLSIDTQLAYLAPFVLVPLRRWPRYTGLAMVLLTLALCFYTFTVTYIDGHSWTFTLIPMTDINPNFLEAIYVKTPHRASVYIVGMGAGFVLSKARGWNLRVDKRWVVAGWSACSAAAIAVVYTVLISYAENYVYNKVDAAFYNGFHRLGWALCLSWIVIACSLGYGGPVDRILSWPGWQPFSRLSFCAYLTHFPFMYMLTGMARNPVFYTHFRAVHRYFSDVFTTLAMATVLHLTVEAPANNLLRAFFNKDRPDAYKPEKESDDGDKLVTK